MARNRVSMFSPCKPMPVEPFPIEIPAELIPGFRRHFVLVGEPLNVPADTPNPDEANEAATEE